METGTGNVVQFGLYPQEKSYGTPIDWYIISRTTDRVLLMAKPVLAYQKYNTDWAVSGIRRWLNNEFYDAAFDDAEKNAILESVIQNDDSVHFSGESDGDCFWEWADTISHIHGAPTRDRIFIPCLRDLINPYIDYSGNIRRSQAEELCSRTYELTSSLQGIGEIRWWLRDEIDYGDSKALDAVKDLPSNSFLRIMMEKNIEEEKKNRHHGHPAVTKFGKIEKIKYDSEFGIRPTVWVKHEAIEHR